MLTRVIQMSQSEGLRGKHEYNHLEDFISRLPMTLVQSSANLAQLNQWKVITNSAAVSLLTFN